MQSDPIYSIAKLHAGSQTSEVFQTTERLMWLYEVIRIAGALPLVYFRCAKGAGLDQGQAAGPDVLAAFCATLAVADKRSCRHRHSQRGLSYARVRNSSLPDAAAICVSNAQPISV